MAGDEVNEGVVVQIWRRQLLRKDCLRTNRGETVQVVYPGRPNGDRGPDFREAIIATPEGSLMKGDVEVHLGSRQWWAHGHHRDSGYNQVVLHVVLWDEGGRPTTLESGREIPVLALAPYLGAPLEEIARGLISQPPQPCFGVGVRWGAKLGEVLDRAGEARFHLKAAIFQGEMAVEEAGEVLYRGLMGALGYSRNKRPFQELGWRLPLRVLEGFSQGKGEGRRVMVLQALLLGMAGLLPSPGQPPPDGEGAVLAREMARVWQHFGPEEAMARGDWHFFRVRPENSPTRRLVGMAYLLNRYLDLGLVPGILGLARAAPNGHRGLEAGLMVGEEGYWGNHLDFGVWGRRAALIGRGRAREMVVNVVLPFFYAWSEMVSYPQLAEHVLDLYRAYPRLGENEITRHMGEMLGVKPGAGARRQQGLLHLHRAYCSQGGCPLCPLARP